MKLALLLLMFLGILGGCALDQISTENLSRDRFEYLKGENGEVYSTSCLRTLGSKDMELAKADLGNCKVSANLSMSSEISRNVYGGGNYWWYDPYVYYYPNWCHYYLYWPGSWQCDYFWPRPRPRPVPQPTPCNQSCLCNITYGNICPAIACTVDQLRACGIYNPQPQPDRNARMAQIVAEIDSLTQNKFCNTDIDCGLAALESTCGSTHKPYSKFYTSQATMTRLTGEYNSLFRSTNPIVCMAYFAPHRPSCQSAVCTHIEDSNWGQTLGTVIDSRRLDGCNFLIRLDSGASLEPSNLPADMKVNGLRVELTYTPIQTFASTCMAGQPVQLNSVVRR